ncbi:MAG: hypothetical protein H6502_04115 [Candidatus Woesearchaeota archaeon]|nr:MAG: hypothetical protein H6502_04115 [Candidatus Woesearchaeota archaeon]
MKKILTPEEETQRAIERRERERIANEEHGRRTFLEEAENNGHPVDRMSTLFEIVAQSTGSDQSPALEATAQSAPSQTKPIEPALPADSPLAHTYLYAIASGTAQPAAYATPLRGLHATVAQLADIKETQGVAAARAYVDQFVADHEPRNGAHETHHERGKKPLGKQAQPTPGPAAYTKGGNGERLRTVKTGTPSTEKIIGSYNPVPGITGPIR